MILRGNELRQHRGSAHIARMKKPGDLANAMKGRDIGKIVREIWIAPRAEAQKRVKQLFEQFPITSPRSKAGAHAEADPLR